MSIAIFAFAFIFGFVFGPAIVSGIGSRIDSIGNREACAVRARKEAMLQATRNEQYAVALEISNLDYGDPRANALSERLRELNRKERETRNPAII